MNLIYFLKLFSFSLLSVTFCLFAGCNMFDFSQKSTKSSDADNDSEITVASYNVQCLSYSADKSAIVEEIKTINPDIIGLQELDNATSRSGYVDQLKMLADECGYEYYYFTKTIDFMGGEYGHGVMSKYPITKTESKKFDEQFGEERCFSRLEIDVNEKCVVFYNTHLAYEGKIQSIQISEIFEMAKNDEFSIITGDMNCTPIEYSKYIDKTKHISLNGGETYKNFVNTCPEGENSKVPIDNIIVSRSFDYYFDKENDNGIFVNRTENSDHNMIYTKLILK